MRAAPGATVILRRVSESGWTPDGAPDTWPAGSRPSEPALPRIEDIPLVDRGYDPERVQHAFDAFYRHAAQLDASLRVLEAVDAFRRHATDLRADIRALRAASWAPQPVQQQVWRDPYAAARGGRPLTPGVPSPLPRLAAEAAFIILVAVGAGLAELSTLMTIAVVGAAWLIVGLVELVAAQSRSSAVPTARPYPSPVLEPLAGADAAAPVPARAPRVEDATMIGSPPPEQPALPAEEPRPEAEPVPAAEEPELELEEEPVPALAAAELDREPVAPQAEAAAEELEPALAAAELEYEQALEEESLPALAEAELAAEREDVEAPLEEADVEPALAADEPPLEEEPLPAFAEAERSVEPDELEPLLPEAAQEERVGAQEERVGAADEAEPVADEPALEEEPVPALAADEAAASAAPVAEPRPSTPRRPFWRRRRAIELPPLDRQPEEPRLRILSGTERDERPDPWEETSLPVQAAVPVEDASPAEAAPEPPAPVEAAPAGVDVEAEEGPEPESDAGVAPAAAGERGPAELVAFAPLVEMDPEVAQAPPEALVEPAEGAADAPERVAESVEEHAALDVESLAALEAEEPAPAEPTPRRRGFWARRRGDAEPVREASAREAVTADATVEEGPAPAVDVEPERALEPEATAEAEPELPAEGEPALAAEPAAEHEWEPDAVVAEPEPIGEPAPALAAEPEEEPIAEREPEEEPIGEREPEPERAPEPAAEPAGEEERGATESPAAVAEPAPVPRIEPLRPRRSFWRRRREHDPVAHERVTTPHEHAVEPEQVSAPWEVEPDARVDPWEQTPLGAPAEPEVEPEPSAAPPLGESRMPVSAGGTPRRGRRGRR